MTNKPGTVSKILWHFTGGPLWDNKEGKQSYYPKSEQHSFEILNKIVSSKYLKTSDYKEQLQAFVIRQFKDLLTDEEQPLVIPTLDKITTTSVVCVADIPIEHLNFHSKRYGKIAIGFKRSSLVRAGFNPVLYALSTSLVSQNYSDTLLTIEKLHKTIDGLNYSLLNHGIEVDSQLKELVVAIDLIEEVKARSLGFGNFIKTFNRKTMDEIYTEREWRSDKPFNFEWTDVAMIVLPRHGGFLDNFIRGNTEIPREVPIVSWEDLIEY